MEKKMMKESKAYPILKALLDALIEAALGVVKAPAVFLSSLAEQLKDKQEEEVKQLEQEIKSITQDELKVMLKEAGCDQKENIEFIVEKVAVALEEIKRLLKIPPEKSPQFPLLPSLHNQTPPEPNFVGRVEMLETITQWYQNPTVRIGALIGWGGVGKSALVRKWYDSLLECIDRVDACSVTDTALHSLQPDGIFWWGFYRNPLLDAFLNELLRYVSQGEVEPEGIKSNWDKVERIKGYLHQKSYLLILDGLEQMQKPESGNAFGEMMHREFTELLHYLADTQSRGLCLITTRFPLRDLANWHNQGYRNLELIDLSIPDALAMLKKRRVQGDDADIEDVITRYKGHALSLTTLAGFLNKYYQGDINRSPDIRFVLSDEKRFEDMNKLLHRYAEKMSPAELCFLKIFSLFRREITERDFAGVFRHKAGFNEPLLRMDDLDFKDLVDGLVEWRLISGGEEYPPLTPPGRGIPAMPLSDTPLPLSRGDYTTHPLIKGYFESIFEEQDKGLCHKRLYQYFGEIAPEQAENLDQMQPLFEQVYHGCQAGRYQEAFEDVYWQKVQRGEEKFLIYKLGAWETDLGLIQNFFPNGDFQKEPLVTEIGDKSYLINEAGLSMKNLGRLKEAEGLFKKKIAIDISQEDWMNASGGCQNLAGLQILTGTLLEARESSEEAIRLSREAGNVRYECGSTAYLSYTLFLLGKMDTAGIEFEKAEKLQGEADSSKRYLYSVRGIQYADFLLTRGKIQEALDVTNENLRIWAKEYHQIDDITLCHRSLAAIYRHLKDFKSAEANAELALEGARKTGRQDIEVESLIELARIKLEQSPSDLSLQPSAYPPYSLINHALQICRRCGYRLYEADAELLLAKAYLAQNNCTQAKSLAQSAYTKADSMHYHLAKLEASQLLEKIKTA